MAAYPETVVLSVFTHGALTVDESKKFHVFPVPPGMTVVKVSATAIGVCNILSSKDGLTMNDELIKHLGDPKLSFQDMQAHIDKVTPYVRDVVTNVAIGRAKKLLVTEPDDEEIKEFFRHPDIGFSKKVYTEGQPIIDKIYGRTPEEAQVKKEKYKYDYKINMLNVPGMPDLFSNMVGVEEPGDLTQIRLGDMLRLLYERGVKNVVLFDFSCSIFDPPLSFRDVRALRRTAASSNLNGGKTRRKTKTSSRKKGHHNGRHQTRSRKVPRHQQASE